MVKQVLCFLLLVPLLVFSGCAKPPDQEIGQANEAMQAAVDAQSEVYASSEDAMAKKSMAEAQAEVDAVNAKFVLFRSYTNAKSLYAAAIDAANKAKEAAIVNKEIVKNEATTRSAEAKTAVDDASKALKTAPRGKDTRADIEAMNADLQGISTSLTEIDEAMAREDFMGAKNKAVSVKDRAMVIQGDIQKAKEKMGRRRK